MNKNLLLITGGTGGHVIPAQNLANYLFKKKINCRIILDKRGYKYINNFEGKIDIINSSNLNGNIIFKVFGLINLFFGFIQSFIIIFKFKPKTVISFGSYASFFPLLSCLILKPFFKIDLFIHEQNSILGRTNSFYLKYVNKILLNFDISSKINSKYHLKTHVVGFPEPYKKDNRIKEYDDLGNKFRIFISGGSQGSEFISKFSTDLIMKIDKENLIKPEYIIQCPKKLINKISNDLKEINSPIIIKDYFYNIDQILKNTSLAISRAGAGSIIDLINYKIPSILIPLPNSKDNHQYYNALILKNHNLALVVNQNENLIIKSKKYIYDIYKDKDKLKFIDKKFDKIRVKNSNSLIYKLIKNEK